MDIFFKLPKRYFFFFCKRIKCGSNALFIFHKDSKIANTCIRHISVYHIIILLLFFQLLNFNLYLFIIFYLMIIYMIILIYSKQSFPKHTLVNLYLIENKFIQLFLCPLKTKNTQKVFDLTPNIHFIIYKYCTFSIQKLSFVN